MAIKDILTIVDAGGARAANNLAAGLAAKLDAHLTGLSLAFDPMISAAGMAAAPASVVADVRQAWRDQALGADAAFQDIAKRADVRFANAVVDMPANGSFAEFLRLSRLADLVVIGQENPDHPEPLRPALIEALLFEGGAPTLVIPYVGTTEFRAGKAVIAWDGSATAARAVRSALPLLKLSDSVTVLMVGTRPAEEAADLATHLDRHGLRVSVTHTPAAGIPVADVLLNTVNDEGFDWLVMGAYGHSRMREYLFGGATHDILGEMTVPVLMTH